MCISPSIRGVQGEAPSYFQKSSLSLYPLPPKQMRQIITYSFFLLLLSCAKEDTTSKPYNVNGRVINNSGIGMEGVSIAYGDAKSVTTDAQGYWMINDLIDENTFTPALNNFTFNPTNIKVSASINGVLFIGTEKPSTVETQIFNWFNAQQLPNGLLESVENGNIVSLYDNALAALVFLMKNDIAKAEKIFDFFNSRIESELKKGVGGFSQLRDRAGVPNGHRWMGDNAWLLIALNNYKQKTTNTKYDELASALGTWLQALQDTDGGLFSGYDASNNLLNYKVTEGNIDAFNAITGYTDFHRNLLNYLKLNRWDAIDKNLVSWPENPKYLYALDVHAWSYCMFEGYPVSALITAQRFLTAKTATNGAQITGYCFDEDIDTVWPEGTGQMAVAFGIAGMFSEKAYYLTEIEKVLIQSTNYSNASGFPYASNPGTSYGADILWSGADTKIAISGGAWYLFAMKGFNPFEVGRGKNIPQADMFWKN